MLEFLARAIRRYSGNEFSSARSRVPISLIHISSSRGRDGKHASTTQYHNKAATAEWERRETLQTSKAERLVRANKLERRYELETLETNLVTRFSGPRD